MAYFQDAKAMSLAEELYRRYKEAWIRENATDDIIAKTKIAYVEDKSVDENVTFDEYVDAHGYAGGTSFYLFNDFLSSDEYHVWTVARDLEQYMFERGEYDYPTYRQIKWLGADRDTTYDNIRNAILDESEVLLDYITNDIEALNPEDELCEKAETLKKHITEFCRKSDGD